MPHWVRGANDKATAHSGKGISIKNLDIVALGNSMGSMKPLKAPVLLINSFEEHGNKRKTK